MDLPEMKLLFLRFFKKYYFVIVLVLLGGGLYANSLGGAFVFDDYKYIVGNPAIRQFRDIQGIWNACNTRFLVCESYAVNYGLGGFSTLGYHIVNVFMHILAAGLVAVFIRLLSRTPALAREDSRNQGRWIARFGALIFLCHPLQTQAVAYIMQRAVSMACVFYLGTLICYLQYRIMARKKYYGAAVIVMICGLFTKESVVTVPFMCLAMDILFFPEDCRRPLALFKGLWPLFLAPLLLVVILKFNQTSSVSQMRYFVGLDKFSARYVWTEMNVLMTYLRLMFVPYPQNYIYDYPVARGLLSWPTPVSLCALLGLCFFIVKRGGPETGQSGLPLLGSW